MATLRTYPDLSARCLQERLDLPLRLWYLLRQHCPDGRGWLHLTDVYHLSCGNRRQTRAWIRKGQGVFWHRRGDRLYLAGLGAVCEVLEVVVRKKPVGVAIEDLENLGRFRAALFATFFAQGPVTISQRRLSEIYGRTARTLYTWARVANVDIQHNLAWSPLPHDGDDLDHWPSGTLAAMGCKIAEEEAGSTNNVWQEGWRELPRKGWRWQKGNKVVLCWQLPNTYKSDLVAGPRTRLQREAARRGRRAPDDTAGANGGQFVKLFFGVGQAGLAARALQSGGDVAFLAEGVEHHGRALWSFNSV